MSRAVISVIDESMKVASTPPSRWLPQPCVGTYHMRKMNFSFDYKGGICKDQQQLLVRAGSKSKVLLSELTFVMFRILPFICALRWARFGQICLP